MSGKKLSFCCVSYNHAKYIADTIKSIINSGLKEIEIIILDDGSKDNSTEIISKFVKKYENIRFKTIFQENSGNVAANFNKALKESSGDYVTFISMDDYYVPCELAHAYYEITKDPSLAFVTHYDVIPVDDNGNEIITYHRLHKLTKEIKIENLLSLEREQFGAFYIQGCIFRTDIIKEVGGFDDDMLGDDIILRTKVFRYLINHPHLTFAILSKPVCCYRRHSGNISRNVERQLKIVSQYLDRYWHDCEPPEKLLEWAFYAIKNKDISDVFNLLAFNQVTAKLLRYNLLQRYIMYILIKDNPLCGLWNCLLVFCSFLIKKEKPSKHDRVIVLLSFIRIKYRKR